MEWEQWLAASRLAVREATRLAGRDVPLHLVGYSNGGALALKYTLDALEDNTLRRPQQLILLSPMIGVTAFARFAGLAGLPALFPAFAKAAWLNVTPEYNPFKYNSFPVNAARQSYLLTKALQQQISRDARSSRLNELPPVLTFQSIMDSTVSTRAVVDSFYRYLGNNGSESWCCSISIRPPVCVRCCAPHRIPPLLSCYRLRRATIAQPSSRMRRRKR